MFHVKPIHIQQYNFTYSHTFLCVPRSAFAALALCSSRHRLLYKARDKGDEATMKSAKSLRSTYQNTLLRKQEAAADQKRYLDYLNQEKELIKQGKAPRYLTKCTFTCFWSLYLSICVYAREGL